MTLVYYYEDGTKQTVHGKSERECAMKMKKQNSKIIRVDRPRTMMEKVQR